MGKYLTAEITIAGLVADAAATQQLVEAIKADDVGCVAGEEFSSDAGLAQYLLDTAQEGNPLQLGRYEAPDGQLKALMEFCRDRLEYQLSTEEDEIAYRCVGDQWRTYDAIGVFDGTPAIEMSLLSDWRKKGLLVANVDEWTQAFEPLPAFRLSSSAREMLASLV